VTYAAASVLLAATLLPELEVDLDQEPSSWDRTLRVFEFYKVHDESAETGIRALWNHRRQFEAIKNRGLSPFPYFRTARDRTRQEA
jgi:hypothetical protein